MTGQLLMNKHQITIILLFILAHKNWIKCFLLKCTSIVFQFIVELYCDYFIYCILLIALSYRIELNWIVEQNLFLISIRLQSDRNTDNNTNHPVLVYSDFKCEAFTLTITINLTFPLGTLTIQAVLFFLML